MASPIAAVIPARWASTRFPGKPLVEIEGRAMIVHVCERVAEARRIDRFWVATDDDRVAAAVRAAGFEARMTPANCATGTDRIAASLREGDEFEIIVNVQGDEPRIASAVIDAVAGALTESPECGVSTAAVALRDEAAFRSPSVVKVVLDSRGRALYFSRSPLPSPERVDEAVKRAPGFIWGLKHLGIYGYRRAILTEFAGWAQTPLEERECLEQLRLLERGIAIQVAVVEHDSIGVDTPEELEALKSGAHP